MVALTLARMCVSPLPQAGAEIPFDDTHLHFGKGQTEASIVLTPGKHKLTLQFANALHKRCGARAPAAGDAGADAHAPQLRQGVLQDHHGQREVSCVAFEAAAPPPRHRLALLARSDGIGYELRIYESNDRKSVLVYARRRRRAACSLAGPSSSKHSKK